MSRGEINAQCIPTCYSRHLPGCDALPRHAGRVRPERVPDDVHLRGLEPRHVVQPVQQASGVVAHLGGEESLMQSKGRRVLLGKEMR